ncbi:MAG TPA: sigma-70 family RNA polymerase sigma factor [Gaiellaceae bacterium]|nr:sigma-70 family RNA polymerase sigma factor [Gaiellaceae bacterium]
MSAELVYLTERFREPEPERRDVAPTAHLRFEQLVLRHDRRLRRLAAGILSRPDRVDDVLQEAYAKAYRKLPRRFANEAHEAVWLHRVVYRCCLDELRRAKRRPEDATAEVERLQPAGEERLTRLALDRAFARLSVSDRAALLLVELAGLDYDAAARVLRVPRGTVASRVNRARERFRVALREERVR